MGKCTGSLGWPGRSWANHRAPPRLRAKTADLEASHPLFLPSAPYYPSPVSGERHLTSRFRWFNDTHQPRIVNPRQSRRPRHQIWREGRLLCTMAGFAMGWHKPDNVAGSSAPAIMVGLFVATGGLLFGYDTG